MTKHGKGRMSTSLYGDNAVSWRSPPTAHQREERREEDVYQGMLTVTPSSLQSSLGLGGRGAGWGGEFEQNLKWKVSDKED